eukprot:3189755-Rhodomonas_salina.1
MTDTSPKTREFRVVQQWTPQADVATESWKMQTHTPMSTRYSLHMHTGKSASGYVAPSKLEAPASLKVSWADANSLVQRSAPTTIRGPKRNVSPDQLDSRYPNHGENFNANTVHSAYALPSLEGFAFKNGAPKRRKSSD